MQTYAEFLKSKQIFAPAVGFAIPDGHISQKLFPFQRDIVKWALRRGKAAVFAHTGLGKGPIQLEWARHIHSHTKRDVLLLAPLAVAQQFQREAKKFSVPVNLCREPEDIKNGINITNYDRLEKFDTERFIGVALDESSCIKNWTAKTTSLLIERFEKTPFKLCSTATPSPNDHTELGTHAELLDVMKRSEMLAMFFEHDGGETSKWAIKGHAKKPFFRFISSWAVCLKFPSDLGYDDAGYKLPPLNLYEHIVSVDQSQASDGMLFRCPDLSATGLHSELRLTCTERAKKVAEIIAQKPKEQWLVWCNTNYEADALMEAVPDLFEVRGNDSAEKKERAAIDFVDGKIKRLCSKGEIYGYGLNLQNCANMTLFADYSFEKIFQIIRRCWRFGQKRPVNAHIIAAETEGAVLESYRRKEKQYEELQSEMNAAMREEQLRERGKIKRQMHDIKMEIPTWLQSA